MTRRTLNLKVIVCCALLPTIALWACGSSNPASPNTTPPTTSGPAADPDTGVAAEVGAEVCSTGQPYDSSMAFPERDPKTPLPGVKCVPRCGDTSSAYWGAGGGPSPTVSALPTGACTTASAACSMSAIRLFCPRQGYPPQGVLLDFECRCADGSWSCAGSYKAGGTGPYPPCHDADAGDLDGSADGSEGG